MQKLRWYWKELSLKIHSCKVIKGDLALFKPIILASRLYGQAMSYLTLPTEYFRRLSRHSGNNILLFSGEIF